MKTNPNLLPSLVLWNGPLFGRLTPPGKNYLLKHGWNEIPKPPNEINDTTLLPFIWPNKSGPQFESLSDSSFEPSMVRPFPTRVTNIFDDKVSFYELMSRYNHHPLIPFHVSHQDLLKYENECNNSSNNDNDDDSLYFVKHRYGAQGKSVYVHTMKELHSWVQKCKNIQDFVIQREVIPALDENGHKFTLRAHVLLISKPNNTTAVNFEGYLNKNIICQPHQAPYKKNTLKRASQISQVNCNTKKTAFLPTLTSNLNKSHPAYNIHNQMKHACKSFLNSFVQNQYNYFNNTTITSFGLFGLDFLVSGDNDVKLCEVNSHPSLGWGSMNLVDKEVYGELIEDTLFLLLFQKSNDGHDKRQDHSYDRLF